MLRNLAMHWTAGGHRVDVLTTQSQPGFPLEEVDAGIRVERIVPAQGSGFALLRWMASVHGRIRDRAREFDVVVASILQHMTAAAVEAARARGVAAVARTEGAGPTGDVHWASHSALRRFIRNRGLRADAVIAVSPEIEQELKDLDPSLRIHLVPNGVPVPERPWAWADRDPFRKRLELGDSAVICFTGRLLAAKGLVELLEAFRMLRDRGRDVQLVLVGEGGHRDRLMSKASSLGIRERVRFVGWTPDVEPYLRAADVFVLPSHVEGRSTSLLEALAMGMPAVASDIPANRGLVPDDVLPLVPIKTPAILADRLEEALARAPSWQAQGERSRQLVRADHSIERVAEQHLDVFRTAVDAASAREAR
jgi:glycosyltransferase involved in cell wall biosynthesis